MLQLLLLVAALTLYVRSAQRAEAAGAILAAVAAQAGDTGSARIHRAVMPWKLEEYQDSARRAARASRFVAGGVLGSSILLVAALAMARDFKARADKLAEVDRLKRDFIANVSHDLKTPLASMQETTDVLLDDLAGPLTPRQRRLLAIGQESGRRLASMVGKLLDLSRLESRLTPMIATLDLAQLARASVDRANAGRCTRNGSAVAVLDSACEGTLVRGDADDLERLLDNLLENALKFSPDRGVVRVALEHVDGTAELTVADAGPGIADADKERVFERFHQTPIGRSVPSRGVGLGLAICKQIVTQAGGRIWITDNAPGSVFHVALPRNVLQVG